MSGVIKGVVLWLWVIKTVGIWAIAFAFILAVFACIRLVVRFLAKSKILNKQNTILAIPDQRISGNRRCDRLRKELFRLVHCRQDTAERLVALAKKQNPGKPEHWYLEKVIFDLKRGR